MLWLHWVYLNTCFIFLTEVRPAELFLQMHLLARHSKSGSESSSCVEPYQSQQRWVLRAIHLNPSCLRYWKVLQKLMQWFALTTISWTGCRGRLNAQNPISVLLRSTLVVTKKLIKFQILMNRCAGHCLIISVNYVIMLFQMSVA